MEERVFSSRESDLKALKKRFKNLNYIAAILCSLGLGICCYIRVFNISSNHVLILIHLKHEKQLVSTP